MQRPRLFLLIVAVVSLHCSLSAIAADNDNLLKDTPFEVILSKARGGDAKAQLWLGKAYGFQVISAKVRMDLKESFKWYVAAATNGVAEAQYRAGIGYYAEAASIYSNKPADIAKRRQSANVALHWLMKAALQREVMAWQELGKGFRDGNVFAKDEVEAYKWFHLAAEAKHQFAEFDRNALSAKLTPAKIEEAKERAVRFNRALEASHSN